MPVNKEHRINADEMPSLFDPIVITLEGKEYRITRITAKMLLIHADKPSEAIGQYAEMLNVKPEEIAGIDIRKLMFLSQQLSKIIIDQVKQETLQG